MTFQRILVALDDSTLSHIVFQNALDLARTNQATLMLFQCLTAEIVGEPMVPIPLEVGLYPELAERAYQAQNARVEQYTQQVIQKFNQYCQIAGDRAIAAEFDYKMGDPGHWICKTAENWQADLVIVGRRGRSGLAEVLLGSVSNYVVHHAPCAVLVIQTGHSGSPVPTETKEEVQAM